MKKEKIIRTARKVGVPLFLLFVGLLVSCSGDHVRPVEKTDAGGYRYVEVPGDPLHVRLYTLDNGLKIYLSRNPEEPRIQTIIAVHAGSTYDPPETTGLAHYFEHLMFKGTDSIGTINWEAERPLLQQIDSLYECYRTERKYYRKQALYRSIDSISQLAARYAIPNEYDKLTASIGARDVNAGTSYDFTEFTADIPSNELEKWAWLESERFRHKVFRLFHTELEAVYEEFNMYQDDDNFRAQATLLATLFPHHPYGRAVIGLPDHIKNPSVKKIYEFAERYYVPNNMAIALAGDLDYEKTVRILDKYFGPMKAGEVTPPPLPEEPPLDHPVEKTVTGPSAESVLIGFRFDGANSDEALYVTLIDMLLNNSKAGLIDLDLKQKQKVLIAGCGPFQLRDYVVHAFFGAPRQGQSLEEVRDLLLGEIEKVKKGEFDDWLIQAVVNNLRRSDMERMENNLDRAEEMISSYILDIPWADRVTLYDRMEKITKKEIVRFAREHYRDNYVVVYKRTGIPDQVVKVHKPSITPIPINRDTVSAFYRRFTAVKVEPIRPVFVDFDRAILHDTLAGGVPLDIVRNETNDLFTLEYLVDMGGDHDLLLPVAARYLTYLGTDRYTAEAFRKELYRLGVDLSVHTSSHRTYISLSGLDGSFAEGLRLLEHFLRHVQPDGEAWHRYVADLLKERENRKKDKNILLWGALLNYGIYGPHSPFTHVPSGDTLRQLSPDTLVAQMKKLFTFRHRIFYYGTRSPEEVAALLEEHHPVVTPLHPLLPAHSYPERQGGGEVLFVDYDMVQTNLLMLARDVPYDVSLLPEATLFNEYFGSGLSSIVFQEIRESKALAYSAFATYDIALRPPRSNYVYAFVGTQADKLGEAVRTMRGLLREMPYAPEQIEQARNTILERIRTERITGEKIYTTWLEDRDRGIDHDVRRDIFHKVRTMSPDDLQRFFRDHVSRHRYTFLVLGSRENTDFRLLKRWGPVREVSLRELYGY